MFSELNDSGGSLGYEGEIFDEVFWEPCFICCAERRTNISPAEMARFARIDSQIRANRLILANRLGVPELNPFLANRSFGGLKIANRSFEAIHANHWHIMKMGVFLRVDSCESIRANLRCPFMEAFFGHIFLTV